LFGGVEVKIMVHPNRLFEEENEDEESENEETEEE
jgi:hypothetical protein